MVIMERSPIEWWLNDLRTAFPEGAGLFWRTAWPSIGKVSARFSSVRTDWRRWPGPAGEGFPGKKALGRCLGRSGGWFPAGRARACRFGKRERGSGRRDTKKPGQAGGRPTGRYPERLVESGSGLTGRLLSKFLQLTGLRGGGGGRGGRQSGRGGRGYRAQGPVGRPSGCPPRQ